MPITALLLMVLYQVKSTSRIGSTACMILFLADGVHHRGLTAPALSQALELPHHYYAGTYDPLITHEAVRECLVLHLIADCQGFPHAQGEVEATLQRYVTSGRPIVLTRFFGSLYPMGLVAAIGFGLRWVRPNDPDGISKSRHHDTPTCVAMWRRPLKPMLQIEHDEPTLTCIQKGRLRC